MDTAYTTLMVCIQQSAFDWVPAKKHLNTNFQMTIYNKLQETAAIRVHS